MARDRHAYYHTHTHTHTATLLFPVFVCVCVCAQGSQGFALRVCVCVLSVHVCNSLVQRLHTLSLLLYLTSPETKSQFLHRLQSDRKMGEWRGEGAVVAAREKGGGGWGVKSGVSKERYKEKENPDAIGPSESHQGHCHVSVSVTQLSPDKPGPIAAIGRDV